MNRMIKFFLALVAIRGLKMSADAGGTSGNRSSGSIVYAMPTENAASAKGHGLSR